MEPTAVVGRITKVHGLKGEVFVQVFSDNPERFAEGAFVFLEDGRSLTIRSLRDHGDRLIVTFAEASDRTSAEPLRGQTLVVPLSMLPDLSDGQYWPHQLEGCEVTTDAGRALGVLSEVIPNAANDLWVAKDSRGEETLIPVLKDVIVSVDVAGRQIVVREIPGLTAPEEDAGP